MQRGFGVVMVLAILLAGLVWLLLHVDPADVMAPFTRANTRARSDAIEQLAPVPDAPRRTSASACASTTRRVGRSPERRS
jgi:hypothetical protein